MTTLYLDTEFNGFRGELISMAIVPSEGPEWYEVAAGKWQGTSCDPWVLKHVVPLLRKPPLLMVEFRQSFERYILGFQPPLVVIADWPEDFVHFCHLMTGPNGGQIDIWPTFKLVHVETHPKVPHNALSDARALRDACERVAA